MAAVGLNPADWALCGRLMAGSLPRGIGCDVAGAVDAIGDGVTDVGIGDQVSGTADDAGQPSAGVAELAILDSWYRVADGLALADAAALPMAVQTATWTLDAMDVGPGGKLLVGGAGTVVGFVAVQIALRRGASVIATAGHLRRSAHGHGSTRHPPAGRGCASVSASSPAGRLIWCSTPPRPAAGRFPC